MLIVNGILIADFSFNLEVLMLGRHLKGFESRTPLSLVAKCEDCGLYRKCNSPKMEVDGEGRRKILVLGEAPGANEDIQGKPFVGDAGQKITSLFADVGIDFRRDCWITNALRCWPWELDGVRKANRTPTRKEIDYCRPNVIRAVKELKPKIIIPLGAKAVESLIGWLWREKPGAVERWLGWRIPCQKINTWICPTWHPSYLGYTRNPVAELIMKRHLKAAVALEGRPWKEAPDHKSQVEVIINPNEVEDVLWSIRDRQMSRGGSIAFDYETTSLKPDSQDSQIFSCSVSDGETTISYPWQGKARKATGILLKDPIPKIGSNIKFEERWTRKEFGHGVRNWKWDTNIAAHVLDNRPGITSIKFQSFVLLGEDSWDTYAKPFLQAKGNNAVNRIKEADLTKLLLYGGMDSLMEWKVAQIQMKQLGGL